MEPLTTGTIALLLFCGNKLIDWGIGKAYDTAFDKLMEKSPDTMGGVGKTELAVKYAREHENDYPGGVCWLNARDANLAAEIIQFVQLQMGLEVPQQDFQGDVLTLNQTAAGRKSSPLYGIKQNVNNNNESSLQVEI
jgi:hypothetical protein